MNFMIGTLSPQGQWIWNGTEWILNIEDDEQEPTEEEQEVIVREERDEIGVNRRRRRDNIRETTRGY